jgi:hypothetical protein
MASATASPRTIVSDLDKNRLRTRHPFFEPAETASLNRPLGAVNAERSGGALRALDDHSARHVLARRRQGG